MAQTCLANDAFDLNHCARNAIKAVFNPCFWASNQFLNLGDQDVAANKLKTVADVVARLRAKRAAA